MPEGTPTCSSPDTSLKVGAELDSLQSIEQATLIGDFGANVLGAPPAVGIGPVTLDGGAGPDKLIGGKKDDRITGGSGNDVVVGGSGSDTLVEQRDANMVLTDAALTIGGETDSLSGIEAAELTGGASPNLLDASAVTNIAVTLAGLGGTDVLKGGARADVLVGGADNDVLAGGKGDDRYVFADGWGEDSILELGGRERTVPTSSPSLPDWSG